MKNPFDLRPVTMPEVITSAPANGETSSITLDLMNLAAPVAADSCSQRQELEGERIRGCVARTAIAVGTATKDRRQELCRGTRLPVVVRD